MPYSDKVLSFFWLTLFSTLLTGTSCDPGYYDDSGTCKPCEDENCQTCSGSGTKVCSVCDDEYAVVPYENGATIGECTSCGPACLTCTSDENANVECTKCWAGYYADAGSCKFCGTGSGAPAGSTSSDACVRKLLFSRPKYSYSYF